MSCFGKISLSIRLAVDTQPGTRTSTVVRR